MTEPSRITQDEKNQLTDDACRQFLQRNPGFFPCQANSDKLVQFVESQLGMSLAAFPYPVLIESWQAAHDHIKATSWFYERPVEEADPTQTAEQQRALETANANLEAAKAEEIRIARAMPIKALGQFTSVENAKLRAQRSVSARTQDDRESNRLTPQELDARAKARNAVMVAHPTLNRNSLQFAKLVQAEMAK